MVGVTVQGAYTDDTASMVETLIAAADRVDAVLPHGPGIKEVVGDKGDHSNDVLADLKALGLRSYLSRSRIGAADAGRASHRPVSPTLHVPLDVPRRAEDILDLVVFRGGARQLRRCFVGRRALVSVTSCIGISDRPVQSKYRGRHRFDDRGGGRVGSPAGLARPGRRWAAPGTCCRSA